MTISMNLDEETALELLMNRLEVWTQDYTEQRLYKQMYEAYIDGGCFDGSDFDPKMIVDNDWVNYCNVVWPDDEEYEGIAELYEENGCGDISCEEKNGGYSFIEAAEKDEHGDMCFLCR